MFLKKEGKRKCYKCKEIYPYDTEHFNSNRGLCKYCSKKRGKIRYQSLMNNLTSEQLLKIRCEQDTNVLVRKDWSLI